MKLCAEDAFMRKWVIFNFLVIGVGFSPLLAQPIGSWQAHYSYSDARLVATGGQNVMCASANGLFSFNLSTRTSKIYSKIDGLSDQTITAIVYHESKNAWIIGYESGAVDIMSSSKIVNLNLVKNLNQFVNKRINDLYVSGDKVYAASDIGILVIDLNNNAFTDIYREIGINGADVSCSAVIAYDNQLFAITNEGILKGGLNANLLDFSNWEIIAADTANYSHLFVSNNQLFMVLNGTDIYRFNDGFVKTDVTFQDTVKDIIGTNTDYQVLTSSVIYEVSTDQQVSVTFQNLFNSGNAFSFSNNHFLVGDGLSGLIEISANSNEKIIPNAPPSDVIKNIRWENDALYTIYDQIPGLFYHKNGIWHGEINLTYQVNDVAQFNGQLHLATKNNGIYRTQTQDFLSSSTIDNVAVSKLIATSNDLYASFNDPVLKFANVSTWQNHSSLFGQLNSPLSVTKSLGDTFWFTFGTTMGYGALAINVDESESRRITQSSGLPSSQIATIAVDLQDEAWFATNRGIAYLTDATFVFNSDRAFIPFFEGQELFKNENVSSIVFDGGNRCWVSTTRGIWVFSPNFSAIEFRFTAENSPLPTNEIIKMDYASNGLIYILTSKGLVSYKSNSSVGRANHADVKIFPNPASIRTASQMGFSGVAENATLKITTIEGALVQSIRAYGSTASWNLRDISNRAVSIGVYLVFSSTFDGQETYVGKFAIVP